MMLEFIPARQVHQRLSEGWNIVAQERGDYAALMHAPDGWEPVTGGGESISLLYRDDRGKLSRLDGKPPFHKVRKHTITCTMPGCKEPHHGLGFCQKHYKRAKHHGHPRLVCKPGPKPKGESQIVQVGK